jgi:Bifunctional DNA primase/polymerase, N-terminal/AAA domain/Primase C terminal 1 (PriCT-1)
VSAATTETAARAAEFVEHARRYSELGWALVRLAGKAPRGRDWQKETPGRPGLVAGRWAVWGQRYEMGVLLGSSGLTVVEDDTAEAYARLLELLGGELPMTPIVKSGGRSTHLYFKAGDQGNASVDGLELRAGAQQCVIPPSTHPTSGKPYEWLEGHEPWTVPLLPVPDELLAHFAGTLFASKRAEPVGDEIREKDPGRHRTLLSLAGSMRRRGMSGDEIAVALLAVNAKRCRPPLPEEEVVELARDVARRYEPAAPDPEQERLAREADQLLGRARAGKVPEQPKRKVPALIVSLGTYLAGTQDEAAWIVDHLIGRGSLTIVAGLPKVGKSTFVYGALGAITAGDDRTFLGLPVQAAAALLLTEESPSTVEEKADRFGLSDERVYVLPKRGARAGRSWGKLCEAVLGFCREHPEIRVVVVDTLDKFADLTAKRSEADTGVIRETIDPLYPILDLGAGVVLITHQRKEEGSYGLRVRGGTSLTGSADVIVEIERPYESAGLGKEARVIKLVSRFVDAPDEIAVELDTNGWRSLGTVTAAVRRMRQEDVLELVGDQPATREQLVDAAAGRLSDRTLRRRLDELVERALVARTGEGTKGDPYYWVLTEAGRIFRGNLGGSALAAASGDQPGSQEPSGIQLPEKGGNAAGGRTPSSVATKRNEASRCVVCDTPFHPADLGATHLRCADCVERSRQKGDTT